MERATAAGAWARIGVIGCFSFYPTKNLGAWGDGGAVVTSVPELADRVRLLRAHGEQPRYHHRIVGTTARLDALQAAVLRRKLARLDGWNDERRRLRQHTAHAAARARGARSAEGAIELTSARARRRETTSITCSSCAASTRDELREHLSRCGVASASPLPDADPPDRGLRRARLARVEACR